MQAVRDLLALRKADSSRSERMGRSPSLAEHTSRYNTDSLDEHRSPAQVGNEVEESELEVKSTGREMGNQVATDSQGTGFGQGNFAGEAAWYQCRPRADEVASDAHTPCHLLAAQATLGPTSASSGRPALRASHPIPRAHGAGKEGTSRQSLAASDSGAQTGPGSRGSSCQSLDPFGSGSHSSRPTLQPSTDSVEPSVSIGVGTANSVAINSAGVEAEAVLIATECDCPAHRPTAWTGQMTNWKVHRLSMDANQVEIIPGSAGEPRRASCSSQTASSREAQPLQVGGHNGAESASVQDGEVKG
ncbi:unnamed protein product [Protopolystoma xenopodis]|uniref:Uncharacterized protein n=1 Tax=Protopolystoma xenopodis TaxID=117903 RepID=A0A3S5FEG5_9PLAT|nr:unnamed protein product [Protopolystoma xenopodis]